jgi:protein-arginine kinase activator protein McsA
MYNHNYLFYKFLFNLLDEIEGKRNYDFLSDLKTENLTKDSNKWKKESYTSKDGLINVIKYVLDTETESEDIKELQRQLDTVVENQDYEKATVLRDKIKSLKNESNQIQNLEKELDSLVKKQNFEEAINVRNKINSIKIKEKCQK